MDASSHMRLAKRAAEYVQHSRQSDDGSDAFARPEVTFDFFVLVVTVLAFYIALIKVRVTPLSSNVIIENTG